MHLERQTELRLRVRTGPTVHCIPQQHPQGLIGRGGRQLRQRLRGLHLRSPRQLQRLHLVSRLCGDLCAGEEGGTRLAKGGGGQGGHKEAPDQGQHDTSQARTAAKIGLLTPSSYLPPRTLNPPTVSSPTPPEEGRSPPHPSGDSHQVTPPPPTHTLVLV